MIGPPKLASCNCFKGSFPIACNMEKRGGVKPSLVPRPLPPSSIDYLQYVLPFPPSSFSSMFAYCKQSKTGWWLRPRNRTQLTIFCTATDKTLCKVAPFPGSPFVGARGEPGNEATVQKAKNLPCCSKCYYYIFF